MTKALKDLALAMLNATLILVVVILGLALFVLNKTEAISATYAETITAIAPLQNGFNTIQTEVSAIQADITALRARSEGIAAARLTDIEQKLTGLEAQLVEINGSLMSLSETPQRVLESTVTLVTDQAVMSLAKLSGCHLTDAE